MHVKRVHRNWLNVEPERALGGDFQMMDLILLALGLGFFVLSVGYAYACDRF